MTPARAAAWRRLAPLTAGVLAVHVVLLRSAPEPLRPARDPPFRLATRTVQPPPAAVAAAPGPVATAPEAVGVAPGSDSAPRIPERTLPARPPQARRAPAPTPPRPPQAIATAEAPAAPAAQPSPITPSSPGTSAAPPATVVTPATPPSIAQAVALPEPQRLRYEVSARIRGLTVTGEAHLLWRHDGSQYQATLEITGPGLPRRVQRSEGRITAEGLAPSYFSDKARGEQATHFDRERARIVFSNNRPQADLQAGMQDRLSVIVQLAGLVAAQPARFPEGTLIAIPTATVRDAETWTFSVEGEEDLQLPGGDGRALKLQRLPRREYDQKVELWLAPWLDYAPVRLRLTNPDGGTVDQRWSTTDRG